jgi:glutamate-1-semialdehyde 2,1-aminomutase
MADIATGLAKAREELLARTPRSRELGAKGAEVLPLEVVATVEMPYTIYIESADGCRMTDVDGNTYIDLTMGFGPHVLGHRPPAILATIREQAEKGWHFGIHNALQERLARLVTKAVPCAESVVFCNSGTEATMYAIRAARAFSGKTKIATFDGSYHGAHDYVLIQADRHSPRSRPTGRPRGRGIPSEAASTVMVLPYRDITAFDLIEEHRDELALVMIEPVQSSNPRLDTRDFMRELARVCRRNQVLFLMDEVITGFRIAYGGVQEYYGITPDLATYGKALGGGLPVGAIVGRAEIMSVFAGRERAEAIFSGGTFSGNPLTMAAGYAAVSYMREHQEIYPYLMEQGDRFAAAINGFCKELDIPAQMMNAASMLHLLFEKGKIESARDITGQYAAAETQFYLHLLKHGVIVPGIHLAFLSAAHRPEDVDSVIDAFKQSFLDLREDFPSFEVKP